MEWWQRFAKLVETRGLTPERIADATGIPVKSIYGYMKGVVRNPRGDVAQRLAAVFGLTEQELRYGVQFKIVNLKRIPLLDLNKLGTLNAGESPLSVWDGVSVVSVPAADVSEQAFGVTLTDDSGAPTFSNGEIIICDPLADIAPGKMVVAAIERNKTGVFRRYRPGPGFSSDKFSLIAPNPDYPQIDVDVDSPGHVIARATKHIRDI